MVPEYHKNIRRKVVPSYRPVVGICHCQDIQYITFFLLLCKTYAFK